MGKLRIAQVAPLYESVPPKRYGGTERVVHNLTEALVDAGHDVTLFASGDSVTGGTLVPNGRSALREAGVREALAPHTLMFERVRALADDFDVIHFHNEYLHFNLARSLETPHLSTLHGRLDLPEYADLFSEFAELPLVSISESQRRALPHQNWLGTVHHGMREDELSFSPDGGDYLAFLGRISPEKGVEEALAIAKRAGMKLKIAAKIERYDHGYYERLKPELEGAGVEFLGEVGLREKERLLGGACGLLFPITWPEPFGLVMIESLAVGTPIVAFKNGSVCEVVRNGQTGFVVSSIDEAVNAVQKLPTLRRSTCRADFEARFTVRRMAEDYVRLYERAIEEQASVSRLRSHPGQHTFDIESGRAWKPILI